MSATPTAQLSPAVIVSSSDASTPTVRRTLPLRARHALLTAHIVLSVGLLGDSAAYLAVAIRTSTIDDAALAHDAVKTLNMFSLLFGIPLSVQVPWMTTGRLIAAATYDVTALTLATMLAVFKPGRPFRHNRRDRR